MKRALVLAGVLLALAASQVAAQIVYDPFFVLPGNAKAMGVDVGLVNGRISKIADMSDVYAMAKYSVNDKIVANLGISLGVAGDAKQADPGIALAVIMDMGK